MSRVGIEILVKEHDNILRLIEVMSKTCIDVMNGKKVDVKLFREYIDFIRNYADKYHHGKEELILFKYMVEKIGGPAEKLVKHGMLVEHDMGRLFVMSLEEALNSYEVEATDESRIQIIANAMGYANHLRRHIDKENNAVYVFAEKHLKDEILDLVDEETLAFENEFKKDREFYLTWLDGICKE